MHIVWFLLIGLAAGWLASHVVAGWHLGLLGSLAAGMAGAVVGGLLFDLLNVHVAGLLGHLLVAFLGAALVLWMIRAFASPSSVPG